MKQLTPITKSIGGNEFHIRPFPAFTAANMTGELANIATPVLAATAPMIVKLWGGGDKKLMDSDVGDLAPALSGAFSGISGDKLEHLARKLLIDHNNISVTVNGDTKPLDQDLVNELFCSEIQDMFLLMWEVIAVNFSGFFKKLAGQFGLDGDLLKTKAPSTASTAPLT